MATKEIRVLDIMRDNVEQLKAVYERLKKEGLERRTPAKLKGYDEQRKGLWNKIMECHDKINKNNPPPPPEYHRTCFTPAKDINDKFIAKLNAMGYKPDNDQMGNNEDVPTPTTSTSNEHSINASNAASTITTSATSSGGTIPKTFAAVSNTFTEASSSTTYNPQIASAASIFMQNNNQPGNNTTQQLVPVSPFPQMENNDGILQQQQAMLNNLMPNFKQPGSISSINIQPSIYDPNHAGTCAQQHQQPATDWNDMMAAEQTAQRNSQQNSNQLMQMLVESQVLLQQKLHETKTKHSLKPKEVTIKKFDGNDITQYKFFKDAITRTLENSGWTATEKLIYLKESLDGEAYNFLSYLQLSDESYEVAWQILDQNYENDRKVLSHIINQLLAPDYYGKSGDASSIKSFRSKFEQFVGNLSIQKTTWENFLAEITIRAMDSKLVSKFEDYVGFRQVTPTLQQIQTFLHKESNIAQHQQPRKELYNHNNHSTNNSNGHHNKGHNNQKQSNTRIHMTQDSARKGCFICKKENHLTIECPVFLQSDRRVDLLKLFHICIYCVKHKYNKNNPCKSRDYLKCEKCNKAHLTELHPLDGSNTFVTVGNEQEIPNTYLHNTMNTKTNNVNTVILPTAMVNIEGANKQATAIRSLIDECAERSYITEHVVQQLKLRKYKTSIGVKGINGITTNANYYAKLAIHISETETIKINALIMPSITGNCPQKEASIDLSNIKFKLADPEFYKPGAIQMLLGVDVIKKLFSSESRIKVQDGLIFKLTKLGWIVSGTANSTAEENKKLASNIVSALVTINENTGKLEKDEDLMQMMRDLFSLPEPVNEDAQRLAEHAEKIYTAKHYREPDGRYVVPTIWKEDPVNLGHSYRRTLRFQLAQEKKLFTNQKHTAMVNDFMEEYLNMDHMEVVPTHLQHDDSNNVCYIPHFSVIRDDAVTTKLRQVFHASYKTSNGISLNDAMEEGVKLQTSIFEMLIRCRTFKYIFGADIEKMFRQIKIIPEDRDMMRVIWRRNDAEKLDEYRLKTVTYGTVCAPYLSIRTIHQCADDNAPSSVLASLIKSSFYVDDLLYGGDTIENCRDLIRSINKTMNDGKFPLTKWMSNNDKVIEEIPPEKRLAALVDNEHADQKFLGTKYNRQEDAMKVKFNIPDNFTYTKRGFSSVAASFFDPMGFIFPFIMALRIFLRNLWISKLGWDDPLDEENKKLFDKHMHNYQKLNNIKIPRWLGGLTADNLLLIGFADASKDAYAAVVYSKVNGIIRLLAAKGNVAKLKTQQVNESKQCTIPKLELEALCTLAELFATLKNALGHLQTQLIAYTDSTIALHWLRNKNNRTKFVQRRIDKIVRVINPQDIHHVRTDQNPADCCSRGMSAEKLVECEIFYNGPKFLQQDPLPTSSDEELSSHCLMTTEKANETIDIFARISNWNRLVMTMAYIILWRCIAANNSISRKPTIEHIQKAKSIILRYYQQRELGQNMVKSIKYKWLKQLSPFIDNEGVLRAGGRLENAIISYEHKHPIILFGRIREMIIRFTHLMHMHAGNSITQRFIQEKYYMSGIKKQIFNCLKKCITCTRWKNNRIQPIMAQLPDVRVQQSHTFENTGIDLCGPFYIKASFLRTTKEIKVWIAVFVCLFTKAAHFEIVTGLSTNDFLNAFERFRSRRGTPKLIWTDNGTNFIGTRNLMRNLLSEVQHHYLLQEIHFRNIPKHSPSFGGIWESLVRSLKYFTKRMESIKNLNYDEFQTIITRIEFLINSRPLTANPISTDEDPALTANHFLTQRGLKLTSIELAKGLNISSLSKKYLTMISILDGLWKRYSTEVFANLQRKIKWNKSSSTSLKIDDVVIVSQPQTQQGDWKLGRVVNLYPDHSGVVRKVDVKTNGKIEVYAVRALIPLNVLNEEINEKQIIIPPQPLASKITKNAQPQNDQPQNAQPQNAQPRRSSRLANRKASKVMFLLAFMACSAFAQEIKQLQTGMSAIDVEDLYNQIGEFEYKINTRANVTADIDKIKTLAKNFTNACLAYSTTASQNRHCMQNQQLLETFAQTSIKRISHTIGKREKRWAAAATTVVKPVLSFGKKHIATLLMAAGMIYQEVEIHGLSTEIDKQREITEDLHNLVKMQRAEINQKFQAIENLQHEQDVKETLDVMMDQTIDLIILVQDKYINMDYDNMLYDAARARYHNDLKLINVNKQTSEVNNVIYINYKATVIANNGWKKKLLSSIPDENNLYTQINSKNDLAMIIATDEYGNYLGTIEKSDDSVTSTDLKVETSFYHCINQFTINATINQLTCITSKAPPNIDKMALIGEKIIFITTSAVSSTQLKCNNTITPINPDGAYILKMINGCEVIQNGTIESFNSETITMDEEYTGDIPEPVTLKIESLQMTDDNFNKLSDDIKDKLDMQQSRSNIIIWIGIIAATIIIVLVMIAIVILKCNKKKEKSTAWIPSYVGPIIAPGNLLETR